MSQQEPAWVLLAWNGASANKLGAYDSFHAGLCCTSQQRGYFQGFFPLSSVFLLTAWHATTLVWP